MKTIRVVAAIIKAMNENNEPIIFATQRGYGDFKGGWEFPGGKIEEGETPQEALVREIQEELDTEIKVGELLETVEYDYPTFHLSMDCFWAEIVSGDLVLKEHEAAKWLTKETLDSVEWLPADLGLVEKIRERIRERMEEMLLICYPKCSTCQKAKRWLDGHNMKYAERHIVESNPSFDELKAWHEKSGLPLKKFFNTSGKLYKEMKLKDKLPTMSEEEMLKLLSTNGMLVKRPIVVTRDSVFVGFKEAEWTERMASN